MKTFTKRVLSLALAVVLFAVCFAGMTVMTATADAAGGGTAQIPLWYAPIDGKLYNLQFSSSGEVNTVLSTATVTSGTVAYDANGKTGGALKLSGSATWGFYTKTNIIKNHEYLISCYVKGTASDSVTMKLLGGTNGATVLTADFHTISQDTEWELYQWNVNVAGTAYCSGNGAPSNSYMLKMFAGNSDVLIDDIRIQEITRYTDRLADGGYIRFDYLINTAQTDTYQFAEFFLPVSGIANGTTYTVEYKAYASLTSLSLGQRAYRESSQGQKQYDVSQQAGTSFATAANAYQWETRSFTITPATDDVSGISFYINTNGSQEGFVLIDDVKVYSASGELCNVNFSEKVYKTDNSKKNVTWNSSLSLLPENKDGGFVEFLYLKTPAESTFPARNLYVPITGVTKGKKYSIYIDAFFSNNSSTNSNLGLRFMNEGGSVDNPKWIRYQTGEKWETIVLSDFEATLDKINRINIYNNQGANVKTTYVLLKNLKIVDQETNSTVYECDFKANKAGFTGGAGSGNDETERLIKWYPYDVMKYPENDNTVDSFASLYYQRTNVDYMTKMSGNLYFPANVVKDKTYKIQYDTYYDTKVSFVGGGDNNVGVQFAGFSGWKAPTKIGEWDTIVVDNIVSNTTGLVNLKLYVNVNSGISTQILIDNVKIYEFDGQEYKPIASYNMDAADFTMDGIGKRIAFTDILGIEATKAHGFVSLDYVLKETGKMEDNGVTLALTGLVKDQDYTISYDAFFDVMQNSSGNKDNNIAVKFASAGYTTDEVKWKKPSYAGKWETITVTLKAPKDGNDSIRIYGNVNCLIPTRILIDNIVVKQGDAVIGSANFENEQPDITGISVWYRHNCEVIEGSHEWNLNTTATEHWYNCTRCNLEKDRAAHIFDHAYDTGCNVCEYVRSVGVCGNVYVDGGEVVIDIFDLFILAKHIAGTDVSSLYNAANADIDGNGVVDQADLDLFATYWLENESFTEDDLPIVPAQ